MLQVLPVTVCNFVGDFVPEAFREDLADDVGAVFDDRLFELLLSFRHTCCLFQEDQKNPYQEPARPFVVADERFNERCHEAFA